MGSCLAGKELTFLDEEDRSCFNSRGWPRWSSGQSCIWKTLTLSWTRPFGAQCQFHTMAWLHSPAGLKGTFCILAFAASNQERMQENKTVSQALFAGAIINIIKQFHKLLPIAGVTFMCRARLSKKGPSCPASLRWKPSPHTIVNKPSLNSVG